jgi:hypothetical protein
MKKIRESGVFERMADRLTKAVALPHDLQVVITDNAPKDIEDPTTELDGRRIFWPAAFSKETYDVLTKFLPEVVRARVRPRSSRRRTSQLTSSTCGAASSSLATSLVTLSSTS